VVRSREFSPRGNQAAAQMSSANIVDYPWKDPWLFVNSVKERSFRGASRPAHGAVLCIGCTGGSACPRVGDRSVKSCGSRQDARIDSTMRALRLESVFRLPSTVPAAASREIETDLGQCHRKSHFRAMKFNDRQSGSTVGRFHSGQVSVAGRPDLRLN
jgi:hypothetical protein